MEIIAIGENTGASHLEAAVAAPCLLANGASLALFLTVSFGPRLISNWSVNIYNYRLSLPVTVAPILLGAFGRRIPRVLVILNGLVLTFLWFGLTASSL